MSSFYISCPSCGSPNDLGRERCHQCGHPLSGQLPSKRVSQPSRSRLSRRTILWGLATVAVAVATGRYLTDRRLTDPPILTYQRPDPHILTYAEGAGVLEAAWSPDGMRVASVSEDDRWGIQIWNAITGEKLATHTLELPVLGYGRGNLLVWSVDGKHVLVFVGSFEKPMVQVWNVASGQHIHSFLVMQSLTSAANGDNQPRMTAWALNERYLAVAKEFPLSDRNPFVEIWDIAAGRKISTLGTIGQDSGVPSGQIYGVDAMVWAPDGEKLALCYSIEQGFLSEIWDATSGKRMPAFIRGETHKNTLAWSPDGKSLAVGTVIWNVETGNKVIEYLVEGRCSLAWSPEGKQVAVASYTGGRYWVPTYGKILVFDVSSSEPMAEYDQGRFDIFIGGMGKMAWSPNGKDLLVLNGRIDLWNMEQR